MCNLIHKSSEVIAYHHLVSFGNKRFIHQICDMLKKAARIFWSICQNPKRLLRVINPDEDEAQQWVEKDYGFAQGLPVVNMQYFLKYQPFDISPCLFLDGGSMPTDLLLLRQLCKMPEVGVYFEIGTWRGESVMNVAPFVNKAYTMNLPDEELKRRGASEAYIKQSGMLIPENTATVIQLRADSQTFDFSPFYGQCDVVFIDGDHHFQSVVQDTQNALKLLKNEHSVIVWHDYGHSPEQVRWEILAAILKAVPQEKHHFLYHVSNSKCAILYPQICPSTPLETPCFPVTHFDVHVQPLVL